MKSLIQLKSVTKNYQSFEGVFQRGTQFKAVDNISLDIIKGRSLGIIGESGSGKSTTAKIIADIVKPDTGTVYYNNTNINELGKKYKEYRKNVQMIFQDPYNSLNPKLKIRSTLKDSIEQYITKNKYEVDDLLTNIIKEVGLKDEDLNKYPHQFSGGQRQRISIARAISINPQIIVADEPISSLDVSIQAQILNLMNRLKNEGITFILISHCLASVYNLCEDIAVFYRGKLVEYGSTNDIINNPKDTYTKKLLE